MDIFFEKVAYVLVLLDNDVRRDIFIGITALLIAVIIFISELIIRQDNDISKRTYLKVLGIGWKPVVVICTMVFMMLCSLCRNPDGIVYYCLQIILNIAIIVSVVMTAQLFMTTARIITNKKYNEDCIVKYVYSRVSTIQNLEQKKEKSLVAAEGRFNSMINNSEVLAYEPLFVERGNMVAIKAISHGRIETIHWDYINRLIKKQLFNERELKKGNEKQIVFAKTIGDLVTEETTIAYCTAGSERIFNNISKAITISTQYSDSLDEMMIISRSLVDSGGSTDGMFDENNRAINYYDFISKNNYTFAKEVFYTAVCEYFRKVAGNEKSLEYARWLTKVSNKAFQNNGFVDYCNYNSLIESLYARQIDLDGIDSKEVAYRFANDFFISPFLITKGSVDNAYYENLMCTLLKLVRDFVRRDEYEAIWILFDNSFFKEARNWESSVEKVNRIHFQFACGAMLCFVLRLERIEKIKYDKTIPDSEKKKIDEAIQELKRLQKKIKEYIFDHYFGIYDAWLFIQCFREYYTCDSQLQNVYRWFELEFEEQRYSNKGTAIGFDICEFLKRLLFTFGLQHAYLGDDYKQNVTWSDKFFYEQLKTKIVAGTNSLYEDIFSESFEADSLVEDLEKIITAAREDEERYKKTQVIDEEKVHTFLTEILQSIREETEFLVFVRNSGKSIVTNNKARRVRGFNTLIPRDCFFTDAYGIETIAHGLGKAIVEAIESDYTDAIKVYATVNDCDLKSYLDSIRNPEEYVLINDFVSLFNISCNTDSVIKIENGLLHSYRSNNVEGAIIVKKEDLPLLEYCDFEQQLPGCVVDGFIEYGLEDCSKDEKLRNDIIKQSEWLRDKGPKEEQEEYLKQQCRLRLYVAYQIIEETNNAVLFNPKKL